MQTRYGILGAGNMAFAIVGGMLGSSIPADMITVYDKFPSQTERFKKLGIHVADSISALSDVADVLFLSVKPQNFEGVLTELSPCFSSDKLIVTIAAGITTDYIRSVLGVDTRVVRVMPNTPLMVGCGASALCRTGNVSDTDFDSVCAIFASAGDVACICEEQMDAIVSVNGSSPAYVYLFVKAMVDAAVSMGVDASVALSLVCKTLDGSVRMIRESGHSLDDLIRMVSSPGGTTLRALDVFQSRDFCGIVCEAMNACSERSRELSK